MTSLSSASDHTKKNSFDNLCFQLYVVLGMLLIMVIIGGLTRLTGSGLSIVEWKPVTGIIPPLNIQDWHLLFESYQQTPEYLLINKDMTLKEFQSIFWLEFIHRLWGRLMGIALMVPVLYSFIQPTLRSFRWPLIFILILGACQGLMGWIMVKSGLHRDPYVNPVCLAIHLELALITYIALLLLVKRLKRGNAFLSWEQRGLVFLMALTLFYGGLVAGHKAGLIYNEFPFMGDRFIPEDFWPLTPGWTNLFFNAATVQWVHRFLGLLTLISTALLFYWHPSYKWVLSVVCLQVFLGIMTLLYQVPLPLALMHQLGAFLSVGVAVTYYKRT